MTDCNIRTAKILAYLGTIPFFMVVFLAVVPLDLFDHLLMGMLYSLAIISFLCGIHWGIYLLNSKDIPDNLFIFSNIITLFAWGVLIFSNLDFITFCHILCFIALFVIDIRLYNKMIFPGWYYHLRLYATLIVVSLLTVLLFI